MRWAGIAIAAYPALCALGFLICSFGDHRLMSRAIDSNRAAAAD